MITFRPARKPECRAIAELYRISSDGVADYIWTGLAEPGEDLLDVGERRYARENTDFSYQNVTVAEVDGQVAGMVAAYPMGPAEPSPESDVDVDPVLRPFQLLEQPNSYYIPGMAVYPPYRGRGIGARLLALAFEQARARRLGQVSLIVLEQNAGARRLYQRVGFHEVMRAPTVPHPLLHFDGDALLLVKDI